MLSSSPAALGLKVSIAGATVTICKVPCGLVVPMPTFPSSVILICSCKFLLESTVENAKCPFQVSASYQRDLYNLLASSGSGTISKITVYFRCKSEFGYAAASIKSGVTVDDGDGEHMDAADWTTFSQEWALNPDDDEAWEWADIDALQIGVNIVGQYGQTTHCTQVYVEVSYIKTTDIILDENVGIGTTTPAVSAKVEIASTTGALLLPRMTTDQRDALTAVNGMLIYNSTLNNLSQ